MSTLGKRVIFVGPADDSNHKPLHVEGVATEASILPGALLAYAASGAGLELEDDAATIFGKPFLIADKDEQRSKSVDDAWTIDENMVAIAPRSGEFFNALVITGKACVPGSPMVRVAGTPGALDIGPLDGTEQILCYADETVTTTATQLVRCRSV